MIPFGKPRKLDNARHCQLWQVTVANAPQAVELESLAQVFEVPLAEGPLKVVSLPGVFSHGAWIVAPSCCWSIWTNCPAATCWTSVAAPVCWARRSNVGTRTIR